MRYLLDIFYIMLLSFVSTNVINISYKPFKINIEHFNWGYTVGLFLIICGFIVTISYNELNSIDHHYNEGYNKALEDLNKMLDNKNHE